MKHAQCGPSSKFNPICYVASNMISLNVDKPQKVTHELSKEDIHFKSTYSN